MHIERQKHVLGVQVREGMDTRQDLLLSPVHLEARLLGVWRT